MNNSQNFIIFEIDGTEYALGFTADSLKQMERNGFKFGKMDESILTAPLELFCGAFIAKHRNVPRKRREEIYEMLTANENGEENKQSLAEALGILLSEAVEELNTHQGNVPWRLGTLGNKTK